MFLLRELAAELPGSRLLVLATCREGAGDPWRTSLADLARLPGVHIMRLAPLSEMAVAGLLRAAGVTTDPELARFVHARSQGNALYVTTLARPSGCGWAPGPSSWPRRPASRSPLCSAGCGGSMPPTSC
jgi:hypothetical protein